MKIEVSPTREFLSIDGKRCRVWVGTLEGAPVRLYVLGIRLEASHRRACEALAQALEEQDVPREAGSN